MRVEVLPNPEAARAATATSPSSTSKPVALSFSDVLARSTAVNSAQPKTSPPGGSSVSPSPPSATPSSLPEQIAHGPQAAKTNVPTDSKLAAFHAVAGNQPALTNDATTPGQSNSKADAQLASNLFSLSDATSNVARATEALGRSDTTALTATTLKSVVETISIEDASGPTVRPTQKIGGQKQAKPDDSGTVSLPPSMLPTLQLSAALDSTVASLLLPNALPIVLPVATPETASSEAFASPSPLPPSLSMSASAPSSVLAPSLTVEKGTSQPVASGTNEWVDARPLPVSTRVFSLSRSFPTPSTDAPLFSTPNSSVDSAQAHAVTNPLPPDSQTLAVSTVNNALQAETASPAPNNVGLPSTETPAPTRDAKTESRDNSKAAIYAHVASANSRAAGFSPTIAAADAALSPIHGQIPANGPPPSPNDDASPKVTKAGANVTLLSVALPANAVPNNAFTGDAPYLHSEPASPVFASKPSIPVVPIASNAALSTSVPAATASHIASSLNEPAPAPSSSSSPVPAPAASTTPLAAPQQPLSPSETSTTQPPASSGAATPVRSSTDFAAGTVLQTSPDNSGPVNISSPQTTPASAGSAIAESVSAAASLPGPAVVNSAPAGVPMFVPDASSQDASLAPTSPSASAKYDTSSAPPTVQGIAAQEGSASLQERRSATSTVHASSSANAAPAPQTTATPALVPPDTSQNTAAATTEKSDPSTPLSPAHQMLDSAPVAPFNGPEPATRASAHLAADAALQMHVGIHTSAFGNVEIHTVLDQSRVGLAIHGDRDLARWFTSEVSGLEAELKSQHLNLTAVDFGSNRSGVQTATSFQQGQPQQNSSQTPGAHAVPFSSATAVPESETETDFDPAVALPARTGETRVSILA